MQNYISNKRIKDDITEMEILKVLDCKTYWDINNILSFQTFINIVMGGRGLGKTTQALIWALKRRKDKGEEFIYLRRYKPDTRKQKNLLENLVKDVKYIGIGDGSGYWSWKNNRLGYLIPLSTSNSYKSVDFSRVSTIIYDEAIILQTIATRYLDNEIFCLLEFMSTVFRHKISGIRIFILGNNLDFFNPYCRYFNITMFKNTYLDKERGILIRYEGVSKELRNIEEQTPLFKATKGTAYHDYHYDNKVIKDKRTNISKKKNNDKYIIGFILEDYCLNVYRRENNRFLLEISRTFNKQGKIVLLQNNQANFYGCDIFKASYLKWAKYNYSNDMFDYCDEDSELLLLNIIDMF